MTVSTGKVSLLFLVAIAYVHSASFPLQGLKCKLQDSECLKDVMQKSVPVFMAGVPELGIEVLDLLEMERVEFDLSGLQFTLNDGRLKGLKEALIESINWDVDKKKVDVVYHMNATVSGHYTAGGRILILPITGDGDLRLKLKNVMIKLTLNYDMKKKDDKEYVHLKNYSFEFEVIDNAHFYLSNLFNGNKQLSDTMHKFLNDNWKQISAEFGAPMIKAAANKLYKNVLKLFNKLPIWEIAIM